MLILKSSFTIIVVVAIGIIGISIDFSEAIVDDSKIDLSIYKLRPVKKSLINRCTRCVTDLAEAAKLLTESLYVLSIKSRCSSFGHLFELIGDGQQLCHDDITNLAVVTTVEHQDYRKKYESILPRLKKDFINTIKELEQAIDIGEYRNTWSDLIYCLIDDYSLDQDVKAFLLDSKRARELNTLNKFKAVPTRVVAQGCNQEELAPLGYVKTIVEMIELKLRGGNLDRASGHKYLFDESVAENILTTKLIDRSDNKSQVQMIIAEIEQKIRDNRTEGNHSKQINQRDDENSVSKSTNKNIDDIKNGTVRDLINWIEETWNGNEQDKTKYKANLYMQLMDNKKQNGDATQPNQTESTNSEENFNQRSTSFKTHHEEKLTSMFSSKNSKKMDRASLNDKAYTNVRLDEIRPPEPIVVSPMLTDEEEFASEDVSNVPVDSVSSNDLSKSYNSGASDDSLEENKEMSTVITEIVDDMSKTMSTNLENNLLSTLNYVRFRLLMQPSRFGLARLSLGLLQDWVVAYDYLKYQKFGRTSSKAQAFLANPSNKDINERIRNDIAIKARIDAILMEMKRTRDHLKDLNDLKKLVDECGHLLALLDVDVDVDDLRRIYNIWSAEYIKYEVTQKFINEEANWFKG